MKKARKKDWKIKPVNKVIQWFDKLIYRVTGRAHNYRVVFGYKQKGQKHPAQVTMYQTFTMTWRPGHDEFYREIRKHFAPDLIKAAKDAYGQLNNGHITIEDIAYLGRH